jgi:beta-lactamase regulating signal transducer with metallopeptidase domain
MNLLSFSFAEWLLRSTVGGGLVLLAGWLLLRVVRQPARRQRIGEASVVAALLVTALCALPARIFLTIPWSIAPAAPASTESPIAETPAVPEHVPAAGQGVTDPPIGFLLVPEANLLVQAPETPAPAPPVVTAEPPAEPGVGMGEWFALHGLDLLAGLYLAAVSALFLRWLLGYAALQRLLRDTTPAPAVLQELLDTLLDGQRRPRLLLSRRVGAPLSCGLWRPTIVLPVHFSGTLDGAALRWVLAHELDHLRRRDPWTCLLFALGQVVYFYLPWFWSVRRQVRLAQEVLADAAAVQRERHPEDYAEFLLSLIALPATPAAALSVRGHPSDLFRRITMLVKTPFKVESRCPRRWWLAAAGCLLALAAFVASVGVRAEDPTKAAPTKEEPKKQDVTKEEPKKEEPKKEEPKKDKKNQKDPNIDFPFPDLEKLLPDGAFNKEQMELLRKEMQRAQEEMRKAVEEMRKLQGPGGIGGIGGIRILPGGRGMGGFGGFGNAGDNRDEARLGARLVKPSAALVEHLDLPKDQGLVLEEVKADSPAAKAGLKTNDILLELNGKPVSSKMQEFEKLLADIKPDTAIEAVVLRKGKKETIKGLKLAEAEKVVPGVPGIIRFPNIPALPPFPGLPGVPGIPGLPGAGGIGGAGGAGNVAMTTSWVNDHFTTRYQEGNVGITLTGKLENGQIQLENIAVKDGDEAKNYKKVEDVPGDFRDDVKQLVKGLERGKSRVKIKKPEEK